MQTSPSMRQYHHLMLPEMPGNRPPGAADRGPGANWVLGGIMCKLVRQTWYRVRGRKST